jgi:hypothetical protein
MWERCQVAHQPFRPRAKGEIDAASCPKKVRYDRKRRAFNVRKEQRWSTAFDCPPVYLGQFKVWVNRSRDLHQLVFRAQKLNKVSE